MTPSTRSRARSRALSHTALTLVFGPQRRATWRFWVAVLAFVVAFIALVGDRARSAPSTVSAAAAAWARVALANRGALEIVAADPESGLITVKAPPAAASSTASGRVLLSGPGYRIATAAPGAGATAAGARGSEASTGGALVPSNLPLERHDHPIVCQGPRLLHIDSRNLVFAGDAIRAEDGCEVHITNSRIIAKDVGVTARAASVHIDNSTVEGGAGAVAASDGAQVYARSSTFKGLIRRGHTAAFHDLGGNAGD